MPTPRSIKQRKPGDEAAPAAHQLPPSQRAPGDKPAQQRVSSRQHTGAEVAKQQPPSSSANSHLQQASKQPDKAPTPSQPTETIATPRAQHRKRGIAAEHQQAADFLMWFGLSNRRVAQAFRQEPQLGALTPAELQARLDALAAAFRNELPMGGLARRVGFEPSLLTLTPGAVTASHAQLAGFGLTPDDASRTLARQLALLTLDTHSLRSNVSSLRAYHQLTPAQLRAVIIHSPKHLLRRHTSAEDGDISKHKHIRNITAIVSGGSSKSARSRAGKVGMASFR